MSYSFWRANPLTGSKERQKTGRRASSSWRAPKTEDLRRELREIKNELRQAKKELRECEKDSRNEKEKHFNVTKRLEQQKNETKRANVQRRNELEESEKLNLAVREELTKQKLALKNEKKKLQRFIDNLNHVQMRDQSNLYRDSRSARYRTPGADKEKLIEEATEKCDKLRGLVLRRWQYREKIRKANNNIERVKHKKQTIKKELSSITAHESEILEIANSLRKGIEASTAKSTLEGTVENSRDVRDEDLVDKFLESTNTLEDILRRVPHEFALLDERQKETAVNPMYRWLMTNLLQKIGLIYIGFNHQFLFHKGHRMDYQQHIRTLKQKKFKLINELDILDDEMKTKQENASDRIPQLQEDISRLKKNKESVAKQFETYKKRKMELENDILHQQKRIDDSEEIEKRYAKLCKEVEELRQIIEKNTDKMNRGGRNVIGSLAMDAIRGTGLLEGSDEDSDSQSRNHRSKRKDDSWSEGVTRGGGSGRDRDDRKWGGGEYSDSEQDKGRRGGSPKGHRGSSPKGRRSVSPSRSSSPAPRSKKRGAVYSTRGGSPKGGDYSEGEQWGED